ncbi:RAD5-like protein [Biscogniauxia marginata]|nr:RAD5-like protein [Biscogniauxia marginata]
MNRIDSDEPPAKKRRFFADLDDASNDPTPTCLQARSPLVGNSVEDAPNLASKPPPSVNSAIGAYTPVKTHLPPSTSENTVAFDENAFQNFVGDKVDSDVLGVIAKHCGNDLERAVNMYLDGTWKKYRNPSRTAVAASLFRPRMSPAVSTDLSKEPEPPPQPALSRPLPETRYIGAFGVEGWVTRSGINVLKYGDVVKIERQQAQPTSSAVKSKSRSGVSAVAARMSPVAARRADVIVRFTDTRGREIGRLAKDAASWISSLMDQNVCKFEATCVYAPEHLRTNETVFLQLRCFLKMSVFKSRKFDPSDNRSTGLFEEKETAEERELRLRQVALVRLFQEINLVPSKGNAASAREVRKGLLDAAEIAEKKGKETHKNSNRDTPGSSPPSEDAEDGEELEQGQLDALYRKAQSFDFNTPEAEPHDTFAMTLRPYQKQSLHWMLAKEKDQKYEARETSMHPLWEEYAWPLKDVDDEDLPRVEGQDSFYVNPYSGEMSLEFPVQEQHCLGGILADEMGLGKTIQMLSLIHSHKSEAVVGNTAAKIDSVNRLARLPSSSHGVLSAPKTTLVIAPMSLLAQWQSEAENASKDGTLKSMVYYGTDKTDNLRALCCDASLSSAPDVVITSYGVVLSEFNQIASRNGNKDLHNGLFSLSFFRIILDEAHTIKNRQSKTAKACYELSAEHRWVLTGTPIVNRLEDLFSLVRFLRVEPWNNFSFWRTFITVPFEGKDFMRALDVVQTVLEPLVMRRTKDMKTPDGELLVPLPPKSVEIVDVELSKAERAVYDYIFTKAQRTFSANIEKGTVMKAYTTIFAQILRLRQTCCHPTLVRNQDIVADEEIAGAEADAAAGLGDDMDLESLIQRFAATTSDEKDANVFGAHVLEQIRDEAVNECPICAEEPMIDQTVTGCWHSACKKCLLDFMNYNTDRHEVPKCFNCREPLNYRDLFEVIRHDDDDETGAPTGPQNSSLNISLQRLGVNESSSKVVALMTHLRQLRREHPRMKSVVFSQFTSFMSLIEPALTRARMRFLRLDGSSSQRQRAAILTEFRDADRFTVLLISLRAGGVGLNLTQARRVFMMDPWWSFAVEAQAIDRVHRMGQDGEVKVYRFITKDSVEERMLRVQERKKFIATSLGMMTDEEKKLQRIEDIKELLS